MIDGDVLVLLEGDAIEAVGKTEHTADDLVELEVRAQHLGIEIIAFHLQLVGIECEVPGLHLLFVTEILGKECFHLFHFFNSRRLVGVNQFVQQLIDIGCTSRHAMYHHVIGKRLIAKELCQLATQIDEPLTNLEVVLAVVMNTLRVLRHIHLLTKLAAGGISHERRHRRMVESEHPAFLLAFAGSKSSSLAGCLGKSVEVLFVGDMQLEGFVFLQQVLRELQREQTGLLGEHSQTFLPCFVEQRTATHKPVIGFLQQHVFLRSELPMMFVDVFDACEELAVECHIIGVLGEDGTHLLSQCVEVVVGLGAEHIRKHRRHTV